MSYEKHTWETGETITAEKLNNLENGIDSISSGGDNDFVVHFSVSGANVATSDKTLKEIFDAFEEGKNVYGILVTASAQGLIIKFYLSTAAKENDLYGMSFFSMLPTGNTIGYMVAVVSGGSANDTEWTLLSS